MRRPSADPLRADFPQFGEPGLEFAIEQLLRVLESVCQPTSSKRKLTDKSASRWQDEDYYYVELALQKPTPSFCDLSIADGKAFIRIVREQTPEEESGPDQSRLTQNIVSIDTPIQG